MLPKFHGKDVRSDSFVFPKPRSIKKQHTYCLDCGNKTQDGKPYCPKHIAKMPYAIQLIEQVRLADEEIAMSAETDAFKKIDPNGSVALDILRWLAWGTRFNMTISKLYKIPPKGVSNYVRALKRAGYVMYRTAAKKKRHSDYRRIVLTARGAAIAGFDLSKLVQEDVVIRVPSLKISA